MRAASTFGAFAALLLGACSLTTSGTPATGQHFASTHAPAPHFVDPARRAKLDAVLPEIEDLYRGWLGASLAPGLSVAIVMDGETVYAKGFGVRDVGSNAPVDADTSFRIASLTKSFTALAILELRDEGKLSLDDPAAKYVPELASLTYPTRDAPPITIRHLLSHGAGFPEDNPWGDRQVALSDEQFRALLASGLTFSQTPDTEFEYSNLGFMILGRIVTRVSGIPYDAYVSRRILNPLGMRSTTFDLRAVPKDRLASGYRADDEGFEPEPDVPNGAGMAMGGLFSTARDMARYAAFHLAAWPARDDPERGPVRRSSVRELDSGARLDVITAAPPTISKPMRARTNAYGFGMNVFTDCTTSRGLTHSGGLPGYGSILVMLPEQGIAIVALSNGTYAVPGVPTRRAIAALARSGALSTRKQEVGPAFLAAKSAIEAAIAKRDPSGLIPSVANNFFMDLPIERWRTRFTKLAGHGACHGDGPIDATNALRGHWHLACEKGWINVFATLAPTVPPHIQLLEMEDGYEPDARLRRAAETLLGSREKLATILAPEADLEGITTDLADVAASRGACKLGPTHDGDGTTEATFQIDCARGTLRMHVEIDPDGKPRDVRFSPIEGTRCDDW